MTIDLGLDRGGAGHRRLRPDQRGRRAPSAKPATFQMGASARRADAALRQHRIEVECGVAPPAPPSARSCTGDRVAIAKHGELAGIDAGGADIPPPGRPAASASRFGLVGRDHRTRFSGKRRSRQGHRQARSRAFQPARLMPEQAPLRDVAANQWGREQRLECDRLPVNVHCPCSALARCHQCHIRPRRGKTPISAAGEDQAARRGSSAPGWLA